MGARGRVWLVPEINIEIGFAKLDIRCDHVLTFGPGPCAAMERLCGPRLSRKRRSTSPVALRKKVS